MTRWFFVLAVSLSLTSPCWGQAPEIKFIADTVVVQAEGSFETDPDLATLTFQISSQDKELRRAYDTASQSMRRIADLAQRNGLKPQDVSAGVLTVAPIYEGDRRKRARAYYVQGEMVLKVRDFSKIGPLMDDSVQEGIVDFRSLTYSLADEETAKQKAVAEGMRRAMGRASAALEQKGQRLGGLRYMNLDVRQLSGVAMVQPYQLAATETVEVSASSVGGGGGGGWFSHRKNASPPPPPPPLSNPEKIKVSATLQCAFGIQ